MSRASKPRVALTRVLGGALGVVVRVVVTVAVSIGALAYLVVAWGQHRRRIAGRV